MDRKYIYYCMVISKIFAICFGIVGFILAVGAAGTSDLYTKELKTSPPGNCDLKTAGVALLFLLVALLLIAVNNIICNKLEYSMDNITVEYSPIVSRDMRRNKRFSDQVENLYHDFLSFEFGKVSESRRLENEEHLERGYGSVVGIYDTFKGDVRFYVDKSRNRLKVAYTDELRAFNKK